MRLLITRPQPDAERTAAALRGRGHTAIVTALVRIEPIANATIGPGPWAAVLITSANAAAAIAAHEQRHALLRLPVFAVGDRSAAAMRAVGFADVISAGGDVDGLVRLVAERMQPGSSLLYLAGEDRSGDLAGDLRRKGFAVDTVVVYRAATAERLPQAAMDALAAGLDGVLHYSRRSAEAYLEAARRSDVLASALSPAHFCLSAQVAEPLVRAGAATIRVASQPNEAALLGLVGRTAQ